MDKVNDILNRIQIVAKKQEIRLVPSIFVYNPNNNPPFSRKYTEIIQDLYCSYCRRESFLEINYIIGRTSLSDIALNIKRSHPTSNYFMGCVQFNFISEEEEQLDSFEINEFYNYITLHDSTKYYFNCCMEKTKAERIYNLVKKAVNTIYVDMSYVAYPEKELFERINNLYPNTNINEAKLSELLSKIDIHEYNGDYGLDRLANEIVSKSIIFDDIQEDLFKSLKSKKDSRIGFRG